MGLANLVPGISGGTMLLAAGVYPAFIEAIAEITTLRIRPRSILFLGAIGGAAALAILLLAGPVKELVVERRWIMYSLFIGLTLGGVPLVWRLARPVSSAVLGGAALGFALMLVMAAAPSSGAGGSGGHSALLFVSGVAGAGAMILPGVSGGYLLLLLGQYVPILSALDGLKDALTSLSSAGLAPVLERFRVLLPVGLGVAAGIVSVSNLLRWLLHHVEKATLGALLGLLVGAVVGLWPFQHGVAPNPGGGIQPGSATALNPETWPVEYFVPTPTQVGVALLLIGLGFAVTLGIDQFGKPRDPRPGG